MVTITRVDKTIGGDIIIPSKLDGYDVTAIGDFAFSNLDNKYKVNFKLIKNGEKWYINSVNFDNGE